MLLSFTAIQRTLCVAGALFSMTQAQAAVELIQNGGFEADHAVVQSPDAISAWQQTEDGVIGSVLVSNGGEALNGDPLPAAAAGQYFGLLDNISNNRQQLSQVFTTAQVSSASLSFSLFFAHAGQGAVSDAGLAYDWDVAGDNLQYRVDLLTGNADSFALQSSLLKSLIVSGDSTAGWHNYSFDISDELAAGGSFQLRFASVSNIGQSQLGIDNVSILAAPVPEPETYALLLVGLGALAIGTRSRRLL